MTAGKKAELKGVFSHLNMHEADDQQFGFCRIY
jgi:hypothetical protein